MTLCNLTDAAWPKVVRSFTKFFFELNMKIIWQDRIYVVVERYLSADSQGVCLFVCLLGKQRDGFHKDY
jgi:hypothetical protein